MSVRILQFTLSDDSLIKGQVATLDVVFDVPVLELDINDFTSDHTLLSNLTTTDGGQTWSVDVTPKDSYEGRAFVSIEGNSYISSVDYTGGDGYTYNLDVDTISPDAPSISFEDTGADDVYNIDEVGDDGTITATVTVPEGTKVGDTVTINGSDYPVTQDVIDNGQDIKVAPSTEVTAIITDAAGNAGDPAIETAPDADLTPPDAPTISFEDPGADGVYNADEVGEDGTITATVTVPEGTKVGDTVTINGTDYPVTQDVIDNGQDVEVAPGTEVTATVTDAAGNTGDPATETVPGSDTDGPDNTTTQLTIDKITDDNTINKAESEDTITVTGKVSGEYQTDDVVTLTINGTDYTGSVNADGSFSIEVAGSDLAADADAKIDGQVLATDAAGNTGIITATKAYCIDTTAPDAPTISFEDPGADGVYNADEVGEDGTITATVTVPEGTKVGDTVTINGSDYPVTQDVIDNGQDVEVAPGTEVTATVTDAAGNTSDPATETAPGSDTDGPDNTTTQLVIDDITDDNTVNKAESEDTITVTGKVSGEYQADDVVTLTVNGTDYTGKVNAEGVFSIEVAGSDLAADADTIVDGKIIATDAAGNTGTITATKDYAVDTQGPTNTTTQIAVDSITADDIINAEEAGQTIPVTGTVSGEFTEGDVVTVTVNDNSYTSTVATDGTFSVDVPGSDLAADPDTLADVVVSATDPAGNTAPVATTKDYEVDTVALAPTVVITEDSNNDGVISYLESDGDIDFTVTVADDTEVGDTLTVDGQDITITQDIIDNGYQGTLPTVDGEQVEITATITDQVGNTSPVAQDSAVVDLTIPDADPIFLWHLGANLTDSQGPSDHRGKYGGRYGDEINYETGILNDYIYIGYEGFDNQGDLVVSPWDGDFERDLEDGDAVWTMETYAGHDYVQIREDQNAYTVAKLGSGDDTYYIQGAMDSDLVPAQNHPDARSYLYTETGDDKVVVGGNGDGKVTGWGIDGGRIFTGSGSDNVTVYGEMDDGGVIDLGAGRTEYANPHDVINANTVDSAEDVNYLTITHNLGNVSDYDFGRIYGGVGDDHVKIGTYVEGSSEINLGQGNNTVSIGDDLDGKSKVVTGSGNDELEIGDDTEDWSSIDLGDGNNSIKIHSTVEDHSTIKTGSGDDKLEVGYAIANSSQVDLGEGNNSITVGDDVDGYSKVTTGSGDDILNIGDDTEDRSVINLGNGDNEISVRDNLEDHSIILTGNGNDTLTVGDSTWNYASVNLGAGNDTVTISGSMHGKSNILLGAGDDHISVGGMHNNSLIGTGEGNDTIVFNGTKLTGTINGDEGEDTLILTFNANDSLVTKWHHETNVSTEDINGIEVIEMTGKNVVDVRYNDLVQDASRDGALFIKGDSDSKVDLGSTNWNSDGKSKAKMDDETGGHWQQTESVIVDGINYDVYQNSQATNNHNDVYIEQGIVVI